MAGTTTTTGPRSPELSLPWVRLDTQFPLNPKILTLVEDKQWRAVVAYVGGLSYSGAHGTDGFLPRLCLPHLHATAREAAQLVAVGLWLPAGNAGWDINGWAEFQPSDAETQQRSQKAREAAQKRWSAQRARDASA